MRWLLCAVVVLMMAGCAKAPITGRSQLLLIDYAAETAMGLSESEKIKQNAKLSSDVRLNARIRQIGARIAEASGEKKFAWEFHVIEEDVANAFCLPGGKVFFYTGILKIMDNDDQIAAVMGHEVAHALARHGGERMSMQMLGNVGGELLGAALEVPAQYHGLYTQAYGMASQVGVMLPFSRKHESEADQIGIYLMVKAGYNPHEAITFWKNMQRLGGKKPPEFLSTHPSDATRIKEIEAYIKTLQKNGVYKG
ncbi:MAG: M48 family metallopeptidase [Campylobacterales bacterium]|nr:M48 family metallopeptidase [Campylobacterales bacterium]